jgi:hypothetical protein
MSYEVARKFLEEQLEKLEEYLCRVRNKGLKVEHIRERWVSTPLGDVRIKRRQYVDVQGKSRYLLDELLGLASRSPLVPELKEASLFLATLLPFRKCAKVLEKSRPQAASSHTAIHRLVRKAAEPYLKAEEVEVRHLYETGEVPVGEGRKIQRLFVEADGTMIALQREKERKAEIKVGIAYEGWEEVSRDRYRVIEKAVYSDITSGEDFWERFSLKLARKYDLAGIEEIIGGGDGAGWVKSGVNLLGGRYQLDRFHLLRALRRALSYQKDLISPVYQACEVGNRAVVNALLIQARNRARGQEREGIEQLMRYLRENADGLRDYRIEPGKEGKGLRRTGAIESNVDKVAANRMKKRGMSWTKAGARSMACLLALSMEGKLNLLAHQASKIEVKARVSIKKVRRILKKSYSETEGKWLQASIPALYGPHASRPWVKYLKSLSEARS